jgi:hypothetical protein
MKRIGIRELPVGAEVTGIDLAMAVGIANDDQP